MNPQVDRLRKPWPLLKYPLSDWRDICRWSKQSTARERFPTSVGLQDPSAYFILHPACRLNKFNHRNGSS